jgi:hypothetical protein
MNMRSILSLLVAALLSVPCISQSPAQLKQELRTKEAAAKQDTDALFQVGKWAEDKGLSAESKRIYLVILKLKPANEAANKALGNELFEGKWLAGKDAAIARKKALEAEFKAKGMVEVGGVYVGKDEVADAKRGVFHFEGNLVTREELQAFGAGKVRHPVTGMIIEPKFLEEAKARKFPIGTEGRWADEKDADAFHNQLEKPWFVRSRYCTLIGTFPVSKMEELKAIADSGVERAWLLMGKQLPHPANRPVILIAATDDEFKEYGTKFGDETSAFGAFLAGDSERQVKFKLEYQGETRPAICNLLHKAWGPYYLRHAAGLAYASGLAEDAGTELPLWLLHAFGGYASRFDSSNDAGSFAEQHLAKGGVKDLKAWLNSFALNGEMEPKELDYNVFQAGLLLSFIADGDEPKLKEAMKEVSDAITSGKTKVFEKSLEKLQAALIAKEVELRAYLQKLIKQRSA